MEVEEKGDEEEGEKEERSFSRSFFLFRVDDLHSLAADQTDWFHFLSVCFGLVFPNKIHLDHTIS